MKRRNIFIDRNLSTKLPAAIKLNKNIDKNEEKKTRNADDNAKSSIRLIKEVF